jgi:hypothetical protein
MIGEGGSIEGIARLAMSGQAARMWRQFALQSSADDVKKAFNDWMDSTLPEGVHAEFDQFNALNDSESNLLATARISGSLGSAAGRGYLLPASFFEARTDHPFVEETSRSLPIDLHYATMERDEVIYHLPAGFSVNTTPRPVDVGWTGHMSLKIDFAASERSLQITRNLVRNSAQMEASDYGNLRASYLSIVHADQQQILLARNNPSQQN